MPDVKLDTELGPIEAVRTPLSSIVLSTDGSNRIWVDGTTTLKLLPEDFRNLSRMKGLGFSQGTEASLAVTIMKPYHSGADTSMLLDVSPTTKALSNQLTVPGAPFDGSFVIRPIDNDRSGAVKALKNLASAESAALRAAAALEAAAAKLEAAKTSLKAAGPYLGAAGAAVATVPAMVPVMEDISEGRYADAGIKTIAVGAGIGAGAYCASVTTPAVTPLLAGGVAGGVVAGAAIFVAGAACGIAGEKAVKAVGDIVMNVTGGSNHDEPNAPSGLKPEYKSSDKGR